jgi:acetyl esterase/lipase/dienelactone hydrolase/lysophospholipase L1-like esterase
MRASATVLISVLGFLSADLEPRGQAGPSTGPAAPKVVLIGDSIRLGYAPRVINRLAGKAVVVSPPENGGDSANLLAHLDEWVVREKPDVVHLNCGLHDLKRARKDGRFQVELGRYEENLRRIVGLIREKTDASIVFADTTPVIDDRHARRRADFDRVEADVRRYNAAAVAVMAKLGVPVNDLHGVVEHEGVENAIGPDGVHYTAAGSARLAEAVSDCVLRQLTVRRYRPLPEPASGPQAAAEYKKAGSRRDALVPEVYRTMRIGEFAVPANARAWETERPNVLRAVRESLGDLPPRPSPVRARVISRELRPGYTLEKVVMPNGVDNEVSALVLTPTYRNGRVPAILWLHSSTPDKTQIIIPGTNGGAESLGECFIRAGYAVLAPDAYWHGDRAGTGPSGPAESGKPEQEDLFKLHLWFGRTLWGMFVRDDQVALDYLCQRPEVDPARIGATGVSMGSTRAWWLAAVDDRVAAVTAVACLTRYQNLIAHGELRAHGVYYFANGLLKHFDTEGVLALIAPRPFLALTGDLDAGSPADGVRALERAVGATYQALGAGDRFRSVLYPGVGHTYTPAMRAEMLAWFARWLRPEERREGGISRSPGADGPGVLSAAQANDLPKSVSRQGVEYLRKLRKNVPFGERGFDLAGLRAGMGTRRAPTIENVTLTRTKARDVPCEWVLAPGSDPTVRLLYLHGGGFVSGSGGFYLPLAARLSAAARCAVLLPDYRLAPEHIFPAGLDDCVTSFEWMDRNGPTGPSAAQATFIAGDSAGGNLALATALALRDRKLPLPSGVVALSAVTDLTLASESLKTVSDPIISARTMPEFRQRYLNGRDPHDPLASPVFGDFHGLPPILIQVGEHEMLRDDSLRLARKAHSDGNRVTLEVWPGMFHVFPSHDPLLPEARQAIAHVADFMQSVRKIGVSKSASDRAR